MAQRRTFTAEDVPLVGGAVALDFLNTAGNRHTATPRERLHGYRDLVTWSVRVGLVDGPGADSLLARAEREPAAAEEALARALRLRADLYAVLRPLAVGEAPTAEAVERLDRWFKEAYTFRTLEGGPDGVAWRWGGEPTRLDRVLWPILGSADAVLAAHDRVKKCGECDWLFLDESRNRSRKWCKKLCADRVRSRRYYRSAKGRR